MAPSQHQYRALSPTESSDEADLPFLPEKHGAARTENRRRCVGVFHKVTVFVNLVLALALAASLTLVARSAREVETSAAANEVWSPAREAIVPVKTKFRPSKIFQSEPSDEVDQAWETLQGSQHGFVSFGGEMAEKLAETNHRSTENIFYPGKRVYALSMYHQLHCLDMIRQSFHRERYFPGFPDKLFYYHKNHCIDFLRQTIICHGDVEMLYWWNPKFTTVDPETGAERDSDWYRGMNASEAAAHADMQWEIEHTCRARAPIDAWVEAHPYEPPGLNWPKDNEPCRTDLCREVRALRIAAGTAVPGWPENVNGDGIMLNDSVIGRPA